MITTSTTPITSPSPFSAALSNAREQICLYGGFQIVDLPFDINDVALLDKLQVQQNGNWDYYGSFENVEPHITNVLRELGNHEGPASALCVERLVDICRQSLTSLQAESGWLSIRSFLPNLAAQPRWHTDGNFFLNSEQGSNNLQMKLAFCLKGRGTLFATLDEQRRAEFELAEQEYQESLYKVFQHREALDYSVRRCVELGVRLNAIALNGNIIELATGLQAGLFAVGQAPQAAIHSQPPLNLPRIFVSIVPGTAAQIIEWQNRQLKK